MFEFRDVCRMWSNRGLHLRLNSYWTFRRWSALLQRASVVTCQSLTVCDVVLWPANVLCDLGIHKLIYTKLFRYNQSFSWFDICSLHSCIILALWWSLLDARTVSDTFSVSLYCSVDKLLSLQTCSDTDFTFSRQRLRDVANLSGDDIMYGLIIFRLLAGPP